MWLVDKESDGGALVPRSMLLQACPLPPSLPWGGRSQQVWNRGLGRRSIVQGQPTQPGWAPGPAPDSLSRGIVPCTFQAAFMFCDRCYKAQNHPTQ